MVNHTRREVVIKQEGGRGEAPSLVVCTPMEGRTMMTPSGSSSRPQVHLGPTREMTEMEVGVQSVEAHDPVWSTKGPLVLAG
ncbi:hypothetical protein AQUCO_07900013v1 [Aquilegia coerulea]|uniref:Uncharacterized protein n=1 Tax=Aquilegia coerulea TaxID=218851 RepID=A0A2G5C7U6_AQUCA|nr:hypothetical protein AQUCO_07900013v1 [Aquilegia coerulea]